MYDLADTIVAPSSAPAGVRRVIRLSGSRSWDICRGLASDNASSAQVGIQSTQIEATADVTVPAWIYRFKSPHSYTGQDSAEIHMWANPLLVGALLQRCLALGARLAGPGEFTARAYLNGRMDLAQAEAVNEIVAGSNALQVHAAQRLLTGRLSAQTEQLRHDLLELMGLLEAGMDFSEEEIEFIQPHQLAERINGLQKNITTLINQGVSQEEILRLPAVGITGAPNAGKSSLFNALLGRQRSLVSDIHKTTRDVLCAVLDLPHGRCVLFDCAGLLSEPVDLLDRLAQQAALEALCHCQLTLFCVDGSQDNLLEDQALRQLVQTLRVLPVATKADLFEPTRTDQLKAQWGPELAVVSSLQQTGLKALAQHIDQMLMIPSVAAESHQDATVLTARHKQALQEAQSCLHEARQVLDQDAPEIVVMELRAAYQALSQMEHHVDERILDRIFSQFCIGK